jgi:hypothetical protein
MRVGGGCKEDKLLKSTLLQSKGEIQLFDIESQESWKKIVWRLSFSSSISSFFTGLYSQGLTVKSLVNIIWWISIPRKQNNYYQIPTWTRRGSFIDQTPVLHPHQCHLHPQIYKSSYVGSTSILEKRDPPLNTSYTSLCTTFHVHEHPH